MTVLAETGATKKRPFVASIGTPWRRDDGVGIAVAQKVRHLAGRAHLRLDVVDCLTDPLDLLGVWDDADLAIVIDATSTGSSVGSVSIIDPDAMAVPRNDTSTHGIGILRVLRLGRATGHAPARVALVGIEGADFDYGVGLSEAVTDALEKAALAVMELLGAARGNVPRGQFGRLEPPELEDRASPDAGDEAVSPCA